MKRLLATLAGLILAIPAISFAQQEEPTSTPAPTTPAPSETPAPPPEKPEPPPDTQTANAQASSNGQWVYTTQYGWIWAPYASNYTYVSPDGGLAYEYAYDPASGWGWLESPWVLGYGPWPYWGTYGYGRYAWYAHPWFHAGFYRGAWGQYGAWGGGRSYGGFHGAAPAFRGGASLGGGFHGGGGGGGHGGGHR
jgi:hypothetical protein